MGFSRTDCSKKEVWLARSQAVSSEMLRQFSACRPFNRDLNSHFTVLTFTRGECVVLFLVCCVFYVSRAPDCDVDAVVGGSVFSRTDCSSTKKRKSRRRGR